MQGQETLAVLNLSIDYRLCMNHKFDGRAIIIVRKHVSQITCLWIKLLTFLNISSVWNLRYFWQPSLPKGIKMSPLFNALLVLTILSSTQAKRCCVAQNMKTNSTIVWVYIDVLSIITYYPQRKSCICERCHKQTINQKIICVHRFNVQSWRWKSIGFSVFC